MDLLGHPHQLQLASKHKRLLAGSFWHLVKRKEKFVGFKAL